MLKVAHLVSELIKGLASLNNYEEWRHFKSKASWFYSKGKAVKIENKIDPIIVKISC